jgi:hypothetical protein
MFEKGVRYSVSNDFPGWTEGGNRVRLMELRFLGIDRRSR